MLNVDDTFVIHKAEHSQQFLLHLNSLNRHIHIGDVCMYLFNGVGVRNSIDVMVETTAVNTIEFTCLKSLHILSGNVFFDGDCCWGNFKFWAFL